MKVSDTAQTGTIANSFTERNDVHTTTGTGHLLYVATRDMASPGATGASRSQSQRHSGALSVGCARGQACASASRSRTGVVPLPQRRRHRGDGHLAAGGQHARHGVSGHRVPFPVRRRELRRKGVHLRLRLGVPEEAIGRRVRVMGSSGHGGASKCGFVQLHGSDRDDTADQFRHVRCWRDPEVDDHVGRSEPSGRDLDRDRVLPLDSGAQGAVAGDTYEIRIASLNTYTQTASLVAVPKPPRRTPFARVRLASG